MQQKKKPGGRSEDPTTIRRNDNDKADAVRAHNEADKDISKDPDWNATSPNDDLDEGESARLGEDIKGII